MLLVLQGRAGEELFWALPGGIVEDDELVLEGLAREVREETGVVVGDVGSLAYVVQVDWRRPARVRGCEVDGYLATVWTFEVASWSGELRVDDPDGVVSEAAFVDVREASKRLEATPWLAVAAVYLRGEVEPGSFRAVRWHADGRAETLWAAAPGPPGSTL